MVPAFGSSVIVTASNEFGGLSLGSVNPKSDVFITYGVFSDADKVADVPMGA